MNEQKVISRANGYITIDIPSVQLPTPVTAARWFATNPIMRALFFMVVGIGIGHFWHSPALPKVSPVPVVTITETLDDFVARESQVLTADERKALIAVTQKILEEHFDTSSAIREEFRFQRLLQTELDSPIFRNFSATWESRLEEMNIGDTVESMRQCYEALLHGLQERQHITNGDATNSATVSPPAVQQRLFRRR